MTHSRKERQSRILHLVSGEAVSSQKGLIARLREQGLSATQATISRDIRELGLVKVADHRAGGGYRYLPPPGPREQAGSAQKVLGNTVVHSIRSSGGLLVLRTRPGHAQSVAADIDSLGWREILGTVGGDDTVIIVACGPEAAGDVKKRLSLFFSVPDTTG